MDLFLDLLKSKRIEDRLYITNSKELNLCLNLTFSNFYIFVNLWYVKPRLLNLIEIMVWNIKSPRHRFAKIIGLENLWQRLNSFASKLHIYKTSHLLWKIKVYIKSCFSAWNQDNGWKELNGEGSDYLRGRIHHRAQVCGDQPGGRAAGVHHLEEGGQDAQLRPGEGRDQVDKHTQLHTGEGWIR